MIQSSDNGGDFIDQFLSSHHEMADAVKRVVGGMAMYIVLSPTDFAALATGIYFCVQTIYVLWKWRKEAKGRKRGSQD